MGNIFAGSEIVELGIQIEKNGRDFYNELVKLSKNQRSQSIFKFLAGEEEKHIIIFQKILEKAAQYEPAEAYPGEYFAYLKALAGDYVFTKKNTGADMAKNAKNEEEAVRLGIGFEKDSILLYEGMKKVVSEDDAKVVDALILQEQNHLRQLLELKSCY